MVIDKRSKKEDDNQGTSSDDGNVFYTHSCDD